MKLCLQYSMTDNYTVDRSRRRENLSGAGVMVQRLQFGQEGRRPWTVRTMPDAELKTQVGDVTARPVRTNSGVHIILRIKMNCRRVRISVTGFFICQVSKAVETCNHVSVSCCKQFSVRLYCNAIG